MQCVILAAGSGSRLSSLYNSKPLLPVLGVPLIERNIRSIHEAGITDFIVVTGHHTEALEKFLGGLAVRLSICIRCVHNPDWASTENGRSLLAAKSLVDGPFILTMADHLAEPQLLRHLLSQENGDEVLSLAVDRRLDNPTVDPADVTRVQSSAGRVEFIGKGLAEYDGWDTGFFYCQRPHDFFGVLQQCSSGGRSALTDAVELLASEARVKVVDIGDCYWNDVDTPPQLKLAEEWLLDNSRGESRDGPVARYLNRPLSIRISRRLAAWPVTPNQISIASFSLSLLAAVLIAYGAVPALVLGGLLAQFASVIDGCDGEIARIKYQASAYGGWLDAVFDRYADAALLFALTWALAQSHGGDFVWLIGSFAIIGSFMVSYTADKYDNWAQQRATGWRLGRDLRIVLIAVAAISGWIAPMLLLIGLLMNGEVIRRVWILRPRRPAPAASQAPHP